MTHKPKARFAALACLLALALGVSGGCARSAGILFPALERPIFWPAPPDPARIRYVGELATSEDLKPPVPFGEALSRAVFGRRETYSMLSPSAVCTDGGNRVFVADAGAQLVHVFDLESRRYARWRPMPPARFTQPVGIAWDPAGRLFVADSVAASVFVFAADGTYRGEVGSGQLTRPAGVVYDLDKARIIVADTGAHDLAVFSTDGKLIQRVGQRGTAPGSFNFPTHLAIGQRGLFVSDTLNFRVQHLGFDFQHRRTIGQLGDSLGDFASPKGVALDSDGHLYVVDAQFESVQIFDEQGRLLLNFGEEGHGPGQFWLPAAIFIDASNRIFVTDAYNRRVQIFEYLPENRS